LDTRACDAGGMTTWRFFLTVTTGGAAGLYKSFNKIKLFFNFQKTFFISTFNTLHYNLFSRQDPLNL